MKQGRRGFTLIELLIVVAVLGILAALLIPNAMAAVQKAKQKGTMKDINAIATAMTDYITDRGAIPNWQGQYQSDSSICIALSPMYIKALATADQWGNGMYIYSGEGWSIQGMQAVEGTHSEFVVASLGRDKAWDFQYDPTQSRFFTVNSMDDFKKDLVSWNGSWVSAPRTEEGTT